jgi:hypothetical protein
MTVDEAIGVIDILSAAYPTYKQFSDPNQIAKTAETWAVLLEDCPVELVLKAVKRHCLLSKYPPTVAEIRENAYAVVNPDGEKSVDEAWGEVVRAIHNYGLYRELEALESLSPQVRKVAKVIGWRELCLSEEPDVIRGQFRKMYEVSAMRAKQDALLPAGFNQLLETSNIKFLEDCYE